MNQNVVDRIQSPGPKKILACDGGGILGLMSIEILLKIEGALRKRLNKGSDFVLADYFDFVCGTSTGAIIATCIAAGMSMTKIRQFYLDSGQQMFDKASIYRRLNYDYNSEPLARLLKTSLDAQLQETDATLGSDRLRTLLMLVMRNATTDSPWPVSNNPFAKYNQPERSDCNLGLPLWQLVRASTAAPTYFPPEVVTLGKGGDKPYSFVFVDGGVTTYNNPAFLAFLMATAKPYHINWSTGADRMLIVSIGTGSAAKARPDLSARDLSLLDNARNIPGALMNAASAGWDMACRLLGECRHGGMIDREFGDMVMSGDDPSNWTNRKLFSYLRYDPDVTQAGLNAMGLPDIPANTVQVLDSIDHIEDIRRVGKTYADKHFQLHHFEGFLS
ncbi:MAG: patatin-like phospholipase family protein [Gammaproteobacteria bacterium]